jgi:hypothetical protein
MKLETTSKILKSATIATLFATCVAGGVACNGVLNAKSSTLIEDGHACAAQRETCSPEQLRAVQSASGQARKQIVFGIAGLVFSSMVLGMLGHGHQSVRIRQDNARRKENEFTPG